MNNIIVAGIVLYNPEIGLLKKNIDSIKNQVRKIIIFDNGSSNIKEIESSLRKYSKVDVLKSKKNLGIAAGLNRIFKFSHQKYKANYILTLDQDSVCPPNLIKEYLKYKRPNVGIFTPLVRDVNANSLLNHSDNETDIVKNCITSAALTNYDAWKIVNGFDESMFIDCVDFDFCNRIRSKSFIVLRVNTITLYHKIGNMQIYKFPFCRVMIKNHNTFRKFYIARNTIFIARKGQKNILISCLQVFKQMLLVILFENNKFEKEKALVSGAYAGMKANIITKWL